ncbi:MAG: hypothetical protein SAJ12_02385 [Jaaginema sp. PMC 1079.18]|nr:hypothetical protein [Jaaginema sp. PMC 1080.18]MEC4849837.1 hypothetical protein [Jaaginema sp. PMC 1079.18]MEC4864550.1 hypothetical protein [Jaaginema sp. PMC 1078.18]
MGGKKAKPRVLTRSHSLFLLGFFGSAIAFPLQPAIAQFVCDGTLYISRGSNPTDPTTLNNLATNIQPFQLAPVSNAPGASIRRYNAAGFRPQDNFIYGIELDRINNTNVPTNILRIDETGVSQRLTLPPGLPSSNFIAGDFNSNTGNYFIYSPGTGELVELSVTGANPTLIRTTALQGSPRFADIAFNPVDGRFYGFDRNINQVRSFDPTSGANPIPLTNVPLGTGTPVFSSTSDQIGAAFFDAAGNFYAFRNGQSGVANSGELYRVDVTTGNFISLGTVEGVDQNDGAGCPLAPIVLKEVSATTIAPGGTVTYTYRIINLTQFSLDNLTFTDTMSDGRTYNPGSVTPGTLLGVTPTFSNSNSTLSFTGVTVPANTDTTLSVEVNIPNFSSARVLPNQAILEGQPTGLAATGLRSLSDFPNTNPFPDPTTLQVTGPRIGVAKNGANPVDLGEGRFNITYTLQVRNFGTVDLSLVQITDDLATQYGLSYVTGTPNQGEYTIITPPTATGNLTPNAGFTGSGSNTNLLDANNSTLAVAQTQTITLTVQVYPRTLPITLQNQVTASGLGGGQTTSDRSVSGLNLDPDNDGNPDEESPTEVVINNNSGEGRLRLVKRVTNIVRNGQPLAGVDFASFIDDSQDGNDNAIANNGLSPVGVVGLGQDNILQSNDIVEYTIYFLSDGGRTAQNIRLCDAIPVGTSFVENSFGGSRGILLQQGSTNASQTNAADSDRAQFFSPLTPANSATPPCPNANNPNGSVLVNLGNIPNTGTDSNGFVRFRVQVN